MLRDEVIPLYYDRDRDGLPRDWIARMKRAIRTLGWRFSADRMVMDYVLKAYIPAAGGTSSDVSRTRGQGSGAGLGAQGSGLGLRLDRAYARFSRCSTIRSRSSSHTGLKNTLAPSSPSSRAISSSRK